MEGAQAFRLRRLPGLLRGPFGQLDRHRAAARRGRPDHFHPKDGELLRVHLMGTLAG